MLSDFGDDFPPKTLCLYSTWHGYAQRPEWLPVRESLFRTGGKLVHAHVSGHALTSDIIRFTRAIGAQTIVPIHTFHPEAFFEHFDNVYVATDGEAFTLDDVSQLT